MDSHASPPTMSVSNLVPSWDDAVDGGGSFEPAAAATVVERVVHADRPGAQRLVSPPEHFEAPGPLARPSSFSDVLLDDAPDEPLCLPDVDYDALHRRDIARELLRARLVAIAEQRHQRSAYEIAFIFLAAAVAVLLAAPPLVQVLLAARGIQA